MHPGEHLIRLFSIEDYKIASGLVTDPSKIAGRVYVETDRRIKAGENRKVELLKEIKFLRRIVEGNTDPGEGFDEKNKNLLQGIVAWAPLSRGYKEYLRYIAELQRMAVRKHGSGQRGLDSYFKGSRIKKNCSSILFKIPKSNAYEQRSGTIGVVMSASTSAKEALGHWIWLPS